MKKMILLALAMAAVCFAYILIRGGRYEVDYKIPYTLENPRLEISEGSEHIEVSNLMVGDGAIRFTVTAVSEGIAEVSIYGDDAYGNMFIFYVHKTGFITEGSLFGDCTGGNIIIIMMTVYAAIVLGIFIKKYRNGTRKNYYDYHNITLLGMILFVSTAILSNVFFAFNRNGLLDFIRGILNASALTVFFIPFAMLITLGVLISNLVLMKKEGVNKKNILGTLFSFGYLVFLIFPLFFEGFLQLQEVIDVHKEKSFAHYFEMIAVNFSYAVTAYMTVILFATIIMGIRAAHRTPAFNKDFILILGCRIRRDGTVTPLLKGRADAAIRFAEKQLNASGKEARFVASGGQGSDEKHSEAEAIRNYLLSCDIPDERIITETNSKNTAENFKFSLEKIKENTADPNPGIAFATTGYHVFRSGYIATKQGIHAEGIGSKTKFYFWINSFIRELIGTLVYEKKKHLLVIATLFAAVVVMSSIVFLSVLY